MTAPRTDLSASAESVHALVQELRAIAAADPNLPIAVFAAAGWLRDLVRERDEARRGWRNETTLREALGEQLSDLRDEFERRGLVPGGAGECTECGRKIGLRNGKVVYHYDRPNGGQRCVGSYTPAKEAAP